jgi:hypothetical protein
METIQLQSKSTQRHFVVDIDETEGARRGTGVSSMSDTSDPAVLSPPAPEVSEKKPRRKYTAAYKLCFPAHVLIRKPAPHCSPSRHFFPSTRYLLFLLPL